MSAIPTRRLVLSLSTVAVTITALTACSSAGANPAQDSETPVPSISASPSPTGFEVKFESTLRSVYSNLDEVGPKDSQTYGLNVLEGITEINERTVRVRMLGTVDYTDRSGPFGGFVELVWSDGTTLAMRQSGTATYRKGNKETDFQADLTVINGSGEAEGTTGTGTWTGTRASTLGSTVNFNATLHLSNAPKLITGTNNSRGTAQPSQSYSATIAP